MTLDTILNPNRELPLFCTTNTPVKTYVSESKKSLSDAEKRAKLNERTRFIKRCYLTTLRKSIQKTLAALYHFASNDPDSVINPHGHWCCFPSVKAIAKRAKLGERTIYKHLKILKQKGYVNYRNRYRMCPKTDQYRQTTNVYYLVTNKVETESYITMERLKAMRGAVSKAIRKGKEAVTNGIPKALTSGKKQNGKKEPVSRYGKDKTSFSAALIEAGNRQSDEISAKMASITPSDPTPWLEKVKRLIKFRR